VDFKDDVTCWWLLFLFRSLIELNIGLYIKLCPNTIIEELSKSLRHMMECPTTKRRCYHTVTPKLITLLVAFTYYNDCLPKDYDQSIKIESASRDGKRFHEETL
jgi:hypothetical protein